MWRAGGQAGPLAGVREGVWGAPRTGHVRMRAEPRGLCRGILLLAWGPAYTSTRQQRGIIAGEGHPLRAEIVPLHSPERCSVRAQEPPQAIQGRGGGRLRIGPAHRPARDGGDCARGWALPNRARPRGRLRGAAWLNRRRVPLPQQQTLRDTRAPGAARPCPSPRRYSGWGLVGVVHLPCVRMGAQRRLASRPHLGPVGRSVPTRGGGRRARRRRLRSRTRGQLLRVPFPALSLVFNNNALIAHRSCCSPATLSIDPRPPAVAAAAAPNQHKQLDTSLPRSLERPCRGRRESVARGALLECCAL
jgi:hypothetical protein